jgi:flagellar L-ring protein precursor FlgH
MGMGLILILLAATAALGQSTSIGQIAGVQPTAPMPREATLPKGNPALEATSLIAVREVEPKKFGINDLVTIIVRVQTQYDAEGKANARRQADLRSELDAFIKFTGDGVGASQFRRGKPNINYRSTFNQRNDAEQEREDRLTTRITGRIIDVKPNGTLVIEAETSLIHDEETHTLTLTGVCRSVDVTPDNTVLSTQVSDLDIKIKTKGTIRNATRSGWAGKLFDWIRPL